MFTQLNDFRRLSSPPAEVIAQRDAKIVELISQLGFKYLLSKPMPRVK